MNDRRNPWKLSERDSRSIFENIVAPRALEGVNLPDTPRIVFVGGQAASSKTVGKRAALADLGDQGAVVADFDALLADHPGYAELLATNDRTAAELAGDDAYLWMRCLIELARARRVNLVREGHMGGDSTEREAQVFREVGFRAEAVVMAVPEALSRLANLNRYQQMRERSRHGRVVAVEIHDRAYRGLPRTLEAADERKFLDSVRLLRWGGDVVYENSVAASGRWRDAERSRDALEIERARPLGSEHVRWFQERYAHLERHLPSQLRAQLPEIARLGHPIGATVRVSPAGQK